MAVIPIIGEMFTFTHEMRLSNGARNRENRGLCSIFSLVATQLDTQDRRLDKNCMLSHGRSVIVHYEREPPPFRIPPRNHVRARRSRFKLDAME